MEGISLHVDTAVHLTPTSVKTDYFRPSCMKRSVTDLNSLPKKRSDRADLETRQSARGNHVPVVSVLYDVPKTPPSPLMYRFRRLHTPLSGQAVGRARSEERINQVAVNVESQRLKGLGVGKCYSEYIPPPTAPEQVRAGFIPGPANSRTSHRQSAMPSPLSQSQSASPSRQLPATPQRQLPVSPHRQLPATPSRQSSNHERAILKSAQTNAINQITNIYNSRQKKNVNKDKETENKTNVQNTRNQHHSYLHSPMLFSQSHHPGAHNVKGEGQIHYHLTHGEGHEGQGYLNGLEGREDHEQSYAAYQNVKSDYSAFLKEYNKSKRQSKLLAESASSVDESTDRKPKKTTDDAMSFTLRDLLIRKSKSEAEKSMLTLPKLNVIQFTQERDGSGNGPPGTNTSNTALLNMNQRLNQMKAQKELTSVQMYSQRMVRLRMSQYQRRQLLPWFGSTVVVPQGLGSSSTPTVPYSTADILYGNDVNGRGQSGEDARQNSFGDLERSRELSRQKSKELEQSVNNRRPSSKSGKQKTLSIDSVMPFDRDREDPLKSLSAALPPAKPSHHFRPNGIKSNLIKSEQNYSSKVNGAATGREQDDLVAMGMLWSPNNNGNSGQPVQLASSLSALSSQQQQQQQGTGRNASVSSSNTNSYPPKLVPTGGSVNQSLSSSNNMLNTQRKYPGNNIRHIVVQNNVSGRKNSNNSIKDQEEPKYSDPMIGAPASFQQRIIELGALEGDTVRWERSKRLKKKKQDRDS